MSTLKPRSARHRTPARRVPPRRAPELVLCVACGVSETPANARLEAWQRSADGSVVHCRACAELLLDDLVLTWAACGHPGEDGAVLYDRGVCLICERD